MHTDTISAATRPNDVQAIKILKKLTAEYADFYDPDQQAYLEDYASELSVSAYDLDQTAKIIGRMLAPAIQACADQQSEKLQDSQATEAQSSQIVATWRDANDTDEDMHIPFEEAACMYEYDQEQRLGQALELHERNSDLRSLQRALSTLTGDNNDAKFTQHDALMQIMHCAEYD